MPQRRYDSHCSPAAMLAWTATLSAAAQAFPAFPAFVPGVPAMNLADGGSHAL